MNNIILVMVITTISAVITIVVNTEKNEDRHHFLWFTVSSFSIIVPMFLTTVINGWYITGWYAGMAIGLNSVITQLRKK